MLRVRPNRVSSVANDLIVGDVRVGWLRHPRIQEVAEQVPCTLLDDGASLIVRVPLDGFGPDQLMRWFNAKAMIFGDDPERTLFDYDPPETVAFVDHRGVVVLTNCEWRGTSISSFGAQGSIRARRAVLGANNDGYPQISGMRTEIDGMNDWIGHRGLSWEVTLDGDSKPESISILTSKVAPVVLTRRLNFRAEGRWRTADATDGMTVQAPVTLTSEIARVRNWDEHLDLHRAVLELIEIACWSRIGFRTMSVARVDDPETVLSGDAVGPKWNQVQSHEQFFAKEGKSRPGKNFLFRWDDIGSRGFRRWLDLRATFDRGVRQFHAILDQPGMYLEVQNINVGSALEAIGFVLAQEAGKSARGAANESYARRLERLNAELPVGLLASDWMERSRSTFMAAKHVDAIAPPLEEQFQSLGESLLAFRAWLAVRLGASPDVIRRLAPADSVVRRFGLVIRA